MMRYSRLDRLSDASLGRSGMKKQEHIRNGDMKWPKQTPLNSFLSHTPVLPST